MPTAKDFRRIALGMKNAVEGAHMGHPDFRVNGRIFAALRPDHQSGMVKLTPDQQQIFAREDPATFMPENGTWGRQGCTRVLLDSADEDKLGEAITIAWQNIANKGAAGRSTRKRANRVTRPSQRPQPRRDPSD